MSNALEHKTHQELIQEIYELRAKVDALTNRETELLILLHKNWINVNDGMPSERDSIFSKIYNTEKWNSNMFLKVSKSVNVVIEYPDGRVQVTTAHTVDGKWKSLPILGDPVVTHWMPFPEY